MAAAGREGGRPAATSAWFARPALEEATQQQVSDREKIGAALDYPEVIFCCVGASGGRGAAALTNWGCLLVLHSCGGAS